MNPLKWGPVPPISEKRNVSHEYKANFISKATFQWIKGITSVGYRWPLKPSDIWLVNLECQIDVLAERFDPAFQNRIRQGKTNPLLKALNDNFK